MNQLTKEQAVQQDLAMQIASQALTIATLKAELAELHQAAAASNGEVTAESERVDS